MSRGSDSRLESWQIGVARAQANLKHNRRQSPQRLLLLLAPLMLVLFAQPLQCGGAAGSCTCRGTCILPYSRPWRASWTIVSEATITPHTLNFFKKLVSTFGIGVENISSSVSGNYGSAANDDLHRRAQATAQDPIFQKMKSQFSSDFDFSVPGAMKLQSLIQKLKKWIKILEDKTRQLPKSFLIEEK